MRKTPRALRPIDMPLYGYWRALLLSWYSPSLYLDVGKRWKGMGLLYLLLLLSVILLPLSVRISLDFRHYFERYYAEPLAAMPLLSIRAGEVTLDKPMPYRVKNRAGEDIMLIDTHQTQAVMDAAYPQLTMVIMKKNLLYRFPPAEFFLQHEILPQKTTLYLQELPEQMNDVFDGKAYVNSKGFLRLKQLVSVMAYPLLVVFFYSLLSVFFLAFSLMTQWIAKVLMKVPLAWPQACRLLVVSATPCLTVLAGFLTANHIFSGLGMVLLIIMALYSGLSVISLKRYANRLART